MHSPHDERFEFVKLEVPSTWLSLESGGKWLGGKFYRAPGKSPSSKLGVLDKGGSAPGTKPLDDGGGKYSAKEKAAIMKREEEMKAKEMGRKDGSLSKAEQFQKDIEDRMRGQTGSPQRKTAASGQQLVGSDAEKYAGINAPYIKTKKDMGGTHNLTISLDSPDTWKSGSINNSRLMKFSFDRGKVEVTTKSTDLPTFRKVKAATPEEAVQKINAYLKKNNLA